MAARGKEPEVGGDPDARDEQCAMAGERPRTPFFRAFPCIGVMIPGSAISPDSQGEGQSNALWGVKGMREAAARQ